MIFAGTYLYFLALFITFVLLYFISLYITIIKWKQLSSLTKKIFLACFIGVPFLLISWLLTAVLLHDSNIVDASDYLGGCKVEEYINGECLTQSARKEKSGENYPYPLVTEKDRIWKRLESYSNEDLMKIAEQELERSSKGEYKGQQRQIERIRSFIDILSKR